MSGIDRLASQEDRDQLFILAKHAGIRKWGPYFHEGVDRVWLQLTE
jgi:hypothetical protein